MTFDSELIANRIREVAVREGDATEGVAHDVAFHMTDWLQELASYVEFCSNPNKMNDKEANEMLLAFLIHVPNHIAAASKLYAQMPVTDVFGVGATLDETDSDD